jgi:hypothetical protein
MNIDTWNKPDISGEKLSGPIDVSAYCEYDVALIETQCETLPSVSRLPLTSSPPVGGDSHGTTPLVWDIVVYDTTCS